MRSDARPVEDGHGGTDLVTVSRVACQSGQEMTAAGSAALYPSELHPVRAGSSCFARATGAGQRMLPIVFFTVSCSVFMMLLSAVKRRLSSCIEF